MLADGEGRQFFTEFAGENDGQAISPEARIANHGFINNHAILLDPDVQSMVGVLLCRIKDIDADVMLMFATTVPATQVATTAIWEWLHWFALQ